MSRVNRFVRLDQFLDRKLCPGTSKMIVRHIYQRGSIKMARQDFESAPDIEPLRSNGVIQEIQSGKKRRVSLTKFALSMIDDPRH